MIYKRFGGFLQLTGFPYGAYVGDYKLDNSNKRWSHAFHPTFSESSKSLAKIRVKNRNKTGTISAGDMVCTICEDGLTPGADIESSSTVTSIPAGEGIVEYTGFSTTIERGKRYWAVIKNANANPVSNNFGVWHMNANLTGIYVMNDFYVNNDIYGWQARTFDGSNWGNPIKSINIEIEYSDGSIEGFIIDKAPANNYYVYSSRKLGVSFTVPAIKLKVVGGYMSGLLSSGATANAVYAIYKASDGSLVAQTTSSINPNTMTSTYKPLYFNSEVTLDANTKYYFVFEDPTASMSYGNMFRMDTDGYYSSNDQICDLGQRFVLYDGTKWTETDKELIRKCGLMLSPNIGEAGGGGGGTGGISRARVVNAGGV